LLGLAAAALLAGCTPPINRVAVPPAAQSGVIEQIREVDLRPRFTGRVGSGQLLGSEPGPGPATYDGDGSPGIKQPRPPGASAANSDITGALPARPPSNGDKGYEMNFENAPIASVAKAILADILGVGYTIDPRVQGTVSLTTVRAVPRQDLIYIFESALRVSNVALVREGRGYRLVPAADAIAAGSIDRTQDTDAGYGVSVVPLQFVSAPTLTKLLENFAAKPGMVRAEPSRNLLVIQGNSADRQAAIETVQSFDADWMVGQSVGIYPVTNSTPEPVIAELERIMDAGEGGLSNSLVRLQPIARQNAILAVTRRPDLLKRVATWITRLDKAGSAGTGVKVYRMRYGDARQVAGLLNDMFLGGSSSSGGIDPATNQLVPGGGAIAAGTGRTGTAATLAAAQSAAQPGTQSSMTAPGQASFDSRFADAAGGRLSQGMGGPYNAPVGRFGGSASGNLAGGPGAILPNIRISPDVMNNSLLIYANQENYRIIERALQQIDRPQMQVAIDATIAEITLNDSLSYGVQFFLTSQSLGLKPDQGSMMNTLNAVGKAAIDRVIPGFNFLVGTEASPKVILDALRTITDVKVLSTPSVVVIDNQFASLLVGDQIPITTRTAQSVDVPTAPVVNNIDYRNTGVILRVAPRINANGNVLLDVEQEISNVAKTPTALTLTPTVSQRKVRSSIGVASGQTVLLAGLISEREDRTRQGIPGLEQIPFLGEVLSHSDGTRQRTELIIFIRPQIIRHGVDAARVAQELRSKLRSFQPLAPAPRGVVLK
jgi:general secretion pathway protein D